MTSFSLFSAPKRIIAYKDLFFIFVWREFVVRYKHSVFGVLWSVIQPLSMMLLFVFIFSFVLKLKVSTYPPVLFYYAGLLPWLFFSSSLNYSTPVLTTQYQLITKIYFPRELLPLGGITIAFIDFLVAASLFVLFLIFYRVPVTWNALWIIPLLVLLVIFTCSVSILFAGLNVYYSDMRIATGFLVQLWFFATPVMYSIDGLSVSWKVALFVNPLTFIIENMRRCLLEGTGVVAWQFALVSLVIAVFYVMFYSFFIRIERAFADVI